MKPSTKSQVIYNWKLWGVKGDLSLLYDYYKSVTDCQHCSKEFSSSFDRCLDHDHNTLEFRKVLCRKCNNCDNHLKEYIPSKKEYDKNRYEVNKESVKAKVKEYKETNKELIREKESEVLLCECGCSVTRNKLSRHKKTDKHNKLMEAIQVSTMIL